MARHTLSVLVLLGLLWSAAAVAQSPTPTHACAAIADPDERLACYDAAFGAPRVDPAVEERRAVEEFGLSETEKQQRDPAKAAKAAAEPKRIEAGVVKLSFGANGERIVSLDNGQVWVTTESGIRGNINVGDKVAVRKAALGTHMLITAARVPLRVKRVR